jgi:hypothetical protein
MSETRNDSAFYTYGDAEIVWEEDNNPFYVRCVGEMRIHATDNDGDTVIIRYTDRLEEFGIKTDKELAEWSDKGEEVFSWVNNSWFEIYSTKDSYFVSEPLHALDEAIGQAKVFLVEYPDGTEPEQTSA